jgi:sulfite reductase (NADPH) flavoprotein alpha-component
MLNEHKKQILENFLNDLPKEQIAWASGYLSGLVGNNNQTISAKSDIEATIIYISETGNAKKIAGNLAAKIKSVGGRVKLKAVEQYRILDLPKEKNLVLITSTHGEGEIPESGKAFYNYLISKEPNLENLKYSILSLGDNNYPLFCEAGKIFDEEFKKLSANNFAPTLDLDLDFEEFIGDWQKQILQALDKKSKKVSAPIIIKKGNKKANYQGEILSNIILNDVGSNKEVHHLEIKAEGLKYEVGDAFAVKINNNAPRMYSIASSVFANENEAHLTVAKVENGICSSYLAGLKVGDNLEFYISKNNNFKLPAQDKNIIMVGPGTGIAPFRGFLQQRDFDGASGKNWLFFGAQNSHSDFLYQSEWQEYLASGLLTKLDVAFSRNQKEKIYVQNRIKENADEMAVWLKKGAYFYVCGDKKNMAKDVEEALIEIIGKQYLEVMKEEGRYLRDVY